MCNREAPGVEQFARQHADQVRVVGLGTQDTFDDAQEFRERRGVTFELLWDPTLESWQALGITSQPAAILLGADGAFLSSWFGPFPEDEVLSLVAG